MPILAVTNLHYAIGVRRLLDGVTFSLEPSEHVGLVGRNGTGKTTLLRIIAGLTKPDAGTANLASAAAVGYLRQDHDFDRNATVREIAESAFGELQKTRAEMDDLMHRMAEPGLGAVELERLMNRYANLEKRLELHGGYAIEHRVEETLHGLGFTDAQFAQKVSGLSGGQLSRLALARLLLRSPDLLLLDEPTNHLDIAGREWLESFLTTQFTGAVIIVSHDRYLLSRAVNRIIELEVDGTLATYPGNYEKFRELRKERKELQLRMREKQLDRIRSEQGFIDRYRAGQRARQAAGREKRLDRFRESIVDAPPEMEVMRLTLPKAPRSGDIVVDAEHISKAYRTLHLFDDLSLRMQRGDRIGIIGPNGAGKSTLVNCLLGHTPPDAGKVKVGANVSIGYFRQSHGHLDLTLTVWQYLQSVIRGIEGPNARASEQQARDLAGAFLFSGDDQEKVLGTLSGGERSRAVLAGLVAGGHNLLVLDEPTNHFDIPSAERLEQALDPQTGFDGTLIMISHDRALLDACVEQLLILDGKGGWRLFQGRYREWEKVHAEELAAAAAAAKKPASPPPATPKQTPPKPKPARQTTPAPGGAITKLSQQKLEARIQEIEGEIASIDRALLDPETHRDGRRAHDLSLRRGVLSDELGPLEAEWTRRAELEE